MKNAVVIFFCLFSFNFAFARDSSWKICSGPVQLFGEKSKLAVNVYEHRSGPDSRTMDLALIFGGNILQGSFNATNSYTSKVVLSQSSSNFEGIVAMNYSTNTLSIVGNLKLYESTSVNANLKCETFGD